MDRRSFLRGFGVGVLFTSIILGISFTVRTSDSFTKKRALELGMTYQEQDSKTVLSSENQTKEAADDGTSKEDKASASPEAEKSKSSKKESSSEKEDNEEKTSVVPKEETTTDTNKKTSNSNDTDMKKEKEKLEKSIREEEKKLTINAGEWSDVVSQKLQKMGIVDDAKAFDKYLDKNGYSSYISAGTYRVSTKDTYSDLAKKITGR